MTPKTSKHIYVPDDLVIRIKDQADTLGVPFNTVAVMAMRAGIASISIATNPDLRPYFEAELKKQGVKDAKTNRSKSTK